MSPLRPGLCFLDLSLLFRPAVFRACLIVRLPLQPTSEVLAVSL